MVEFAAELIKHLSKVDPGVDPAADAKKCVMRIYRDVRFSNDKTPYKNYFGIGKFTSEVKSAYIGYFLHVEPGNSYIAGGCWQPEGDYLKAIRQEIDYNASELKKIVDSPEYKALFGEFRDQEQLKTVPSGYQADNENIGLIKLKSFVAVHRLTDQDLIKEDAVEQIAAVCGKIYPLNVFLNNAIA